MLCQFFDESKFNLVGQHKESLQNPMPFLKSCEKDFEIEIIINYVTAQSEAPAWILLWIDVKLLLRKLQKEIQVIL